MSVNNIESSLLKNIKYNLLSKWLDGDTEIMHIDNILSMAGAMLFPFLDEVTICLDDSIIQKKGTLKYLVESLRRFSRKNKSVLSKYSFDALSLALKKEWLSSIDFQNKKDIAKCVSIIQNIEPDGFVSIKGNEKVWNSIVNLGVDELDELDPIYGDSEYESQLNGNNVSGKSVKIVKILPNVETNAFNKKLEDFWRNNILSDNYSVDMPFVWKLRISETNYSILKELLFQASNQKKSVFLSFHAEKLLVFGAEWFRREYEGKGDNAFKDFANNIQAKDIFDYLPSDKWDKYVYKGEAYDCWLYSLYVLGGLPVNYTSNNLNQLYDSIFRAMNGDSEALTSEKNFNNTAILNSLMEGGSLYAFVSSIIDKDLPFNEDDFANSIRIQEFIRRINEGKKRSRSEKFSFDWIVYYDNESDLAERKFRISFVPERDGQLHSFVSYRRMQFDWGIVEANEITSFVIKCQFNNAEPFTILRFSNQYNGFFTGWTSNNYIDVENHKIPKAYIDSIKLYISYKIGDEEKSEVIQKIDYSDHYMQLYKGTQDYIWETSIHSGTETAVLYRNDMHLVSDNLKSTSLSFFETNYADSYNWCRFPYCCKLVDANGKEIELKRRGSSIEICPKSQLKTIEYINGRVKYVSEGNESFVPLIIGSDGFDVFVYEYDNGKQLYSNDYTLLYKTSDIQYYKQWDNPGQGFLKLKVEYQGRESVIEAFYLPDAFKTGVRRNLEKDEIVFCPRISNIRVGDKYLKSNIYRDVPKCDKFDDTINFCIGTEGEFVELKVYRPSYKMVLSFNDKPIYVTFDKDKIIEIPIVNSDCMSIYTIDADGKKTLPKQNVGFCDFEEEISWIKSNTHLPIEQGNIKYIVGNQEKDYGIGLGKVRVSREFVSEYQFYYWSMRKTDSPIQLKTQYDDVDEVMTLEMTYHNRSGIIFQSLRNLNPPRYWLPNIHKAKSFYEFNIDTDTKIKCIDIAIDHHIYFKMFEPLYSLIPESTGLKDNEIVKLFYQYAESKNNNISEKEYEGLHRFADEFMFDWLFLQRRAWTDACKMGEEKKQLARKLFQSNTKLKNKSLAERVAHQRIVETYWSGGYPNILDNERWKPKGRKVDSQAIRFMNSFVDNHEFTGRGRNYETIKNFLHDLYEREDSFDLIYKKISEELFIN